MNLPLNRVQSESHGKELLVLDTLHELTLLLMYLNSWQESTVPVLRGKPKPSEFPLVRVCWKGYDFDVLNDLTAQGFVNADGRGKLASFNDEGIDRVKELAKKYGVDLGDPDSNTDEKGR